VFVRVAVAIAGVGLLVAGGTAVFVTDNGTGSAALVSLGAALLLAAGLWDRLESFEFAGAKMQMRIVERLRDRAAEAEARGDTAVAAALREEARALLEEARPIAASYEQLRESLAPGPERTAKLEAVVAEARAAARQRRHEPAEVRQLFERGTDGERMYALGLMQEDERLRDFAVSLEAIEHSRSAFEQYYALSLAELMLPALTEDQRRQLDAMLTKRPGNAAYIRPGTDRWIVAEQILSSLRSA
jgi:hypothetical protein